MIDPRELLEMAAKAAGWVSWDWLAGNGVLNVYDAEGRHDTFDPLTDDGDALRLAVKLEIFTGRFYDCVVPACFASWDRQTRSLWEPAGDDPYAATRRAIVRAAAEIARAGAQKGTL